MASEEQVAAKVAEWNATYRTMSREIHLDDLSPEGYEAEVGDELFGVCGENTDLAIAVFKHEDNEGGWMVGDVVAFLERKQHGDRGRG